MGRKGSSTNAKCQRYLNNRTRIKNKEEKLKKFIEHLQKERVNPQPTKPDRLPRIVRPIENIIKSCRIGRKKEGWSREDFKFRPRKKKEIIYENKESNPKNQSNTKSRREAETTA